MWALKGINGCFNFNDLCWTGKKLREACLDSSMLTCLNVLFEINCHNKVISWQKNKLNDLIKGSYLNGKNIYIYIGF